MNVKQYNRNVRADFQADEFLFDSEKNKKKVVKEK